MKKLIFILLFVPYWVWAQNEADDKTASLGVGIVPSFAVINGLRADVDIKLKKNNWLVVAPQFYVSSNGSFNHDYNSLNGLGLELQHKIFVQNQKEDRGIYFAYGPTFNYYNVKDDGLVAYKFEENGGNYIGLKDDEITTSIYKFGGNVIVGIQSVISDFFYIDPYVGFGLRYSYDNQTSGLHSEYNDSWFDVGYSGTLLITGVRLGFLF